MTQAASSPSGKPEWFISGFLLRVGMLLASPGRALSGIQIRRSGGVGDALGILLLSLLCGRMADLVRAILMLRDSSWPGMLQQLLGITGADLRPALFIALPAGLGITALAGRGRRDPSVDIELGAACTIPYLLLSGLREWARGPVLRSVSAGWPGMVLSILAVAWALLIFCLALRLARQRPVTVANENIQATPKEPVLTRRDRRVASVLGAVLAGVITVNIIWLSHNPDAVAPIGRGIVAPDFELPRVDGTPGTVSLAQLRGKVVLLDFWARWCPPCLAMMPTLHDIYLTRRAQDVEFLSISAEGLTVDREEIQDFLRQHPAPYPSLLDDREVGGLYRVVSLPHLVIIGRDGVIRRVMVGQRRKAEVEAEIQRALEN